MSWRGLVCLLLCSCYCLQLTQADSKYVLLDYSGGTSLCNASQCDAGLFPLEWYDCDSSATWNNGSREFVDPIINPNIYIDYIILTMYGVFGCGSSNNLVPIIQLFLDNVFLGFWQMDPPTNCACLNCAHSQTFYRQVGGNWSDYVFGGVNSFQITSGSTSTDDDFSMCVSTIGILFSYTTLSNATTTTATSSTTTSGFTTFSLTSGQVTTGSPIVSTSTSTSTTGTTNGTNPDNPPQQQNLVVVGAVMLSGMVFVNMCLLGGWYALKKKPGQSDEDSEAGAPTSPHPDMFNLDKTLNYADLVVGERIGRGSFGEVYSGTWFQTHVAIKKLPLEMLRSNASVLEEFTREITLLRSLRHPNILQFLGATTIPPNVCLVTEYMRRGDLHKIIHDKNIVLDKPLMKRIAIDVSRGMLYLHSSNPMVIHRDLKSHNVLIGEHWVAKVADFGLSKIIQSWEETSKYTPCGTPKWAAPEVLRNEIYTTKADVYSFGIILWEMTTRQDPFPGMSAFELIVQVGKHGLRPGALNADSNPLANLIAECWEDNPKLRPSFERVLSLLEAW